MTTPRVPLSDYGRDHWSLLLYLESRTVDQKGVLDARHMRTDVARHPLFSSPTPGISGFGNTKYPTRLRNDGRLDDHDDWDCLYDLVREGLVQFIQPKAVEHYFDIPVGARGPIRGPKGGGKLLDLNHPSRSAVPVQVGLTESGWKVAAQLREYKGNGNSISTFSPSL